MQTYSIDTYRYDANMEALLVRRLKKSGLVPRLAEESSKQHIRIEINDNSELTCLCGALADLLTLDLRHFELARMVNSLPFTLEQKQSLLPEVVKATRDGGFHDEVCEKLKQYLSENTMLTLEGYLRFALQNVIDKWALSVDSAAEEMMLHEEYIELLKLLDTFMQIQTHEVDEIKVILNLDGSCTITNDDDIRIDCAPHNDEGVVRMLKSMLPRRIMIYDLGFGRCQSLLDAIKKAFDGQTKSVD